MDPNGDNAILRTLAYADAAGMPLTAMQIWQRLPTAAGLSLVGTLTALDRLSARGTIREWNGWYATAGTGQDAFVLRLDRLNVQAEKFRTMLRKAYWLQAVPFVRMLAASGSLASGITGPDSDWDMFVVVRRGRLYTGRILVLAAAWLMRSLRTKRDTVAPDKFCFNHCVTDDALVIRHRSRYVAYALASLVPVYDPHCCLERLWHANGWVSGYLMHWPPDPPATARRSVAPSRLLAGFKSAVETVLASPLGGALEAVLRSWQQRRIRSEPLTHARGGRVIADFHELEFHPHSAERSVLARYNSLTAAMGMPAHEKDSGLR